MYLVKNQRRYWEFIRQLRNDPDIQKGFVEQVNITYDQQTKYMEKHNKYYYVCVDFFRPLGYVGVIDRDIRVAVAREAQGRGVGKYMIKEIMKLHPDACAKIKHGNTASIKLFESCGFRYKRKDKNFLYYDIQINQAQPL